MTDSMRSNLAILLLFGLHTSLLLAEPESTFTTGHILVADGGWTAGYHHNIDSLSSFTTQHNECD